jgi:hypothetical protein
MQGQKIKFLYSGPGMQKFFQKRPNYLEKNIQPGKVLLLHYIPRYSLLFSS